MDGALAEPTSERILKGLDCQTALRGSFGPQRISGAVSNQLAGGASTVQTLRPFNDRSTHGFHRAGSCHPRSLGRASSYAIPLG